MKTILLLFISFNLIGQRLDSLVKPGTKYTNLKTGWINYSPTFKAIDSTTTFIAFHVSSIQKKDSVIMTAKESFIWFSKITSREEYDLWTNQFHFDKTMCPRCRYVEVRVSELWKVKDYTFKEFGDLIFPSGGGN